MTSLSNLLLHLAASRNTVSLYFYPDRSVSIEGLGWVKTTADTALELKQWIQLWRMTSGIGEDKFEITLHNIDAVIVA